MNILIVTEDVPVANLGGAGKHAILLGNALIDLGHHVELLGRIATQDIEGTHGFAGRSHCCIDLRGTGWQEFRFGAFLPGSRDHAAWRIWRAIKALDVRRYDVIHYHGHYSAVGNYVPAALNFVQTLHDQGSECLTRTRFRKGAPCGEVDPRACAECAAPDPNFVQVHLSAWAARRLRASAVTSFNRHSTIFVSEFLRRRFTDNVQPQIPLRSHVVHNFTDAQRLRGAAAASLQPNALLVPRPLLLIVGRVDAAKGVLAFLEVLPDSLLKRFSVRVIGTGPDRATAEAKHGPRGVEFKGYLSQAMVYAETMCASLCVVPSIWEEPCGTTILEALALGVPVLALRRGGTPELVRYERYGGQLSLHDSLEQLIESLNSWREPHQSRAGVDEGADVGRRIPEILSVYRGEAIKQPASETDRRECHD